MRRSDTHTLPKGNAWCNPNRELICPWCCNGHKDSSVFCKCIHGGDRNKFTWKKTTPSPENGNVTLMRFSLYGTVTYEVDRFIEQANTFHQTIKFTAEISENEITFLDAVVIKGDRLVEKTILDIKTHYKPTETRLSIYPF